MFKRGSNYRRFWRPVIGIAVAYAVAVQSLLLALGGFQLVAHANAATPGFELCVHDAQGAPAAPDKAPSHPGCSHCIFCFAGAHHALIGSPPVLFVRVDVAVSELALAPGTHAPPRLSAYSIASPRGPPLRA
jgi:hypothetical protein